ncbi:FKBP-type peptidyl-prolyl cis-trans isomerase [Mucilaginibacter pocheonensis]|uniref:peptidylprolyl isomerase n=1 Tax=Mucilaginibacter pocheonensis TaxID=398050 RepID=A0ABU1T4J9_9SPHI|nr:FKBP-type peptidyl-prolyl cis-trans isomerase [Mucilaginibacter pocheonensis]MDR6940283.1 FKBP-type peptidyl-prolyl cis-trans isomerase [Mucilaginibacter pocheonensis]
MKQTIFTLLLITSIGLISCRKNNNDPDIKQYDLIQIQNYIAANGLTGMKRDTVNDTTGIYYQILSQGSTTGVTPLNYADSVAFVYTFKSFDGKYTNVDTLNLSRFDGLLGHITNANNGLTKGLQDAIHDLVKYRGTRARILVPSRMAYGVRGAGTGSSSNVNTRIAGNQCLDYYVNVISDVNKYDDYLIKEYIKKHNLSGYTEITSGRGKGVYYKVTTPGSGTGEVLDYPSSITCLYTGKLLNDSVFDSSAIHNNNDATATSSFDVEGLASGVQEALKGQTTGAVVSMLIPSRLAYGKTGSGIIGVDACLYFDFTISSITNP